MRAEHIVLSVLGLFCCAFMILEGVLFFMARYVPSLEASLRGVTQRHIEGLSYFGLALLFLAVLLLVLFFLLNRRRYLLFNMGNSSIEDRLISHLAGHCLQPLFPNDAISCDVIVKKKQLEFLIDIPFVDGSLLESTLKKIEENLGTFLQNQCQYSGKFILNVSFLSSSESPHHVL